MLGLLSDAFRYTPRWVKLFSVVAMTALFILFCSPYVISIINADVPHIKTESPTVIDKLRASREYVRYTYREFMFDGVNSDTPPIMRHRGIVRGIDKAGFVHLTLYTSEGKRRVRGQLADLKFSNPSLVAEVMAIHADTSPVVADTYAAGDGKHFVVWLKDGTPINEVLIIKGIATPIDTPPTNIVNSLFRNHYREIISK